MTQKTRIDTGFFTPINNINNKHYAQFGFWVEFRGEFAVHLPRPSDVSLPLPWGRPAFSRPLNAAYAQSLACGTRWVLCNAWPRPARCARLFPAPPPFGGTTRVRYAHS